MSWTTEQQLAILNKLEAFEAKLTDVFEKAGLGPVTITHIDWGYREEETRMDPDAQRKAGVPDSSEAV